VTKIALLIVLIVTSLSLTSCRSNDVSEPVIKNRPVAEIVKPVVANVSISKYQFIPNKLKIKLGQTVRWVNNEKRQYHSIWFEKNGEKESNYLFPNDTYTKRFTTVGTFEYRCGPHPEMIAIVIVE